MIKKYDNVASLEFFSSFDTSNFINNPTNIFIMILFRNCTV